MRQIFFLLPFLLISFLSLAQNQNISGGVIFEGEPYMIQNPKNPNHFVVAWIGYIFGKPISIKTKATFDGGKTWSNYSFLPHHGTSFHSADPSMAFDKNGNLFACYIDHYETATTDSGGVYVAKSLDGGLTWTGGTSKVIDINADGTKYPLDRPWLSIDNSNGAFQGHQYVTTKPAPWVAAPNRPYFEYSTNGSTWLPWRHLDTTNFLVGNFISAPMAVCATASNGNLFCLYPSYVSSQNILPGFILAKSTNGGVTFSYHGAFYQTSNQGTKDTSAKLGYHIFIDPTDTNHIAFIAAGNPVNDYDIFLVESKDGGNTWAAPLRINNDALNNGKMQELVWADFDKNGNIGIAWRDHRNGVGTGYATASEIWGAVKWKDSTTALANFRISDTLTAYNATYLNADGNDFMCVTMANDTLNAAWGDVRTGHLNIYFSRVALKHNNSTSVQNIVHEELPKLKIYPNPCKDKLSVVGIQFSEKSKIELFDIAGKKITLKVFSLTTDNRQLKTDDLKSGTYILKAEDIFGNEYAAKFVKE